MSVQMSRMRHRMKNESTPILRHKGDRKMNVFQMFVLIGKFFIAILLAAAFIFGIGYALSAWFGKNRGKQEKKNAPTSPQRAAPAKDAGAVSEQDKARWRELYDKAQRLEEEMVLLTGGKTGMVVQKDAYLHPETPAAAKMYRNNFMMKQKRLKEAYEEYCALRAAVEQLPEACGRRLRALRDEELYLDLIHEKLE